MAVRKLWATRERFAANCDCVIDFTDASFRVPRSALPFTASLRARNSNAVISVARNCLFVFSVLLLRLVQFSRFLSTTTTPLSTVRHSPAHDSRNALSFYPFFRFHDDSDRFPRLRAPPPRQWHDRVLIQRPSRRNRANGLVTCAIFRRDSCGGRTAAGSAKRELAEIPRRATGRLLSYVFAISPSTFPFKSAVTFFYISLFLALRDGMLTECID